MRVGAAGPRLALVWQAQYTERPGGAAARVGAAGPRLALMWQTQKTEPPGGAAARVGAAGPLLVLVWQAQYTEPLVDLRRVAVGPRLPLAFAWQAQHTELPGGAAAHVVAVGPRLAAHRAFRWSCGARGRRWAAAASRVAGAVLSLSLSLG